jgi:hypothetical protein
LLRVGRQGQVQEAVAEQVNLVVVDNDEEMERWRKMLANSALAAARKWTFDLPTSGGHVNDDYWVARVAVVYGLRRYDEIRADDYGKWQPYVPGPKQPLPWIADPRLLSGSADALPDGGIHPLEKDGLRLMTPPGGA